MQCNFQERSVSRIGAYRCAAAGSSRPTWHQSRSVDGAQLSVRRDAPVGRGCIRAQRFLPARRPRPMQV